jgi:hypothetical protein
MYRNSDDRHEYLKLRKMMLCDSRLPVDQPQSQELSTFFVLQDQYEWSTPTRSSPIRKLEQAGAAQI